jgi:CheY-like chemotaxis protein
MNDKVSLKDPRNLYPAPPFPDQTQAAMPLRFWRATNSSKMVLTDVHMPGAHMGLDLARMVKPSYRHIKVAVMSGQHRPSDDDRHLSDLFLQKPVLNIVSALSPLAGNIDG